MSTNGFVEMTDHSEKITTNGAQPTSKGLSERDRMTLYWEKLSTNATVEGMMLDTEAVKFTDSDRDEILSLLPDYTGKDMLELAAGIGRFTGILAKKAKSLTVVEFMENFIKANQEANGHMENIKFIHEDATKLKFENNVFDIVFSCWLLMYLSDGEVKALAESLLKWTKEGGLIVFRESCFRQSGNVKRLFNPTKYRTPQFYNSSFASVSIPAPQGGRYRFELVRCKNVETYIHKKGQKGQLSWCWKKVWTNEGHGSNFQEFLDSHQYTLNGILRYEKIFGEGYVSTGGIVTTEEFVRYLNLRKGQKVLDVGCGIGGGDFYMAEKYGVQVHGIDLSVNMINLALERSIDTPQDVLVSFEICDATLADFKEESFDVVYSRDTLLHIKDKLVLFKRLHKWLRPGGRLLISDYCKGEGEGSSHFQEYVKQREYFLHTVKEYGSLLEEAGFVEVSAQDRTDQFVQILKDELIKFRAIKEEFVKDFSDEDYSAIDQDWQNKIVRCTEGDQKWGLFLATKTSVK